jgi:hypothetical protein
MTNEQAILEQSIIDRLDRLEARLVPMCESARGLQELKDDILPMLNGTVQILIQELGQVESGFKLDDLFRLFIKALRNVKNLTFALEQMENLIDFVQTIEPLLKSSVPQLIQYLDELERNGVLRIIQAGLGVRSKIASAYSAEDIDQIGDGLVVLIGLAKRLSDPKARELLDKLAALPSDVDLSQAKEVGPLGLLSAAGRSEVKEGLGVVMELTKALGKLKN